MNIKILKTSDELGLEAAQYSTNIINQSIKEKGTARIILSTGASQLDTIKHLVRMDIDWKKVELFHLDEYINLPESHPASFKKYLKERFLDLVQIEKVNFVETEGDLQSNIQKLTQEIRKAPIDLALIGIGENAHIAFNDPPADFDTKEAFIVVELDEPCKQQQVREGWFQSIDEVPKTAITMTPYQIMQSNVIVSCVPKKVKANAIKRMLESNEVTNQIPATLLRQHHQITLFLDEDSASLINDEVSKAYL
jgi:glucosamine-6-phosphate deaminase